MIQRLINFDTKGQIKKSRKRQHDKATSKQVTIFLCSSKPDNIQMNRKTRKHANEAGEVVVLKQGHTHTHTSPHEHAQSSTKTLNYSCHSQFPC